MHVSSATLQALVQSWMAVHMRAATDMILFSAHPVRGPVSWRPDDTDRDPIIVEVVWTGSATR